MPDKSMNIVVSVNEAYLDKAESMLFSLREHVDERIVVWFLNHSVDSKKTKDFEEYLRNQCDMELVNITVDNSFFDSMPLVNDHLFSIEIYYRIMIPWLLPKQVHRALWLDADIIVCRDVSELYNKNCENHCIVACIDQRQLSETDRS